MVSLADMLVSLQTACLGFPGEISCLDYDTGHEILAVGSTFGAVKLYVWRHIAYPMTNCGIFSV